MKNFRSKRIILPFGQNMLIFTISQCVGDTLYFVESIFNIKGISRYSNTTLGIEQVHVQIQAFPVGIWEIENQHIVTFYRVASQSRTIRCFPFP
ncbi:hypothetical protein SDC9_91134 [bioreactor metagenome]|uniref:Uncharacterized protein n=1 Tax=bioreactor metagenome TaxID=1076179 RepID=A0A644ZUQ2_9ZZZZ